jgi:hypothetical protein
MLAVAPGGHLSLRQPSEAHEVVSEVVGDFHIEIESSFRVVSSLFH